MEGETNPSTRNSGWFTIDNECLQLNADFHHIHDFVKIDYCGSSAFREIEINNNEEILCNRTAENIFDM